MSWSKEQVERVASIADSPLKHLERRYNELAAAMSKASDHAQQAAEEAVTDAETMAQVIMSAHSKGIAAGLELAATEIGQARQILQESLDEVRRLLP